MLTKQRKKMEVTVRQKSKPANFFLFDARLKTEKNVAIFLNIAVHIGTLRIFISLKRPETHSLSTANWKIACIT